MEQSKAGIQFSVLVAARNEAENITSCLQALEESLSNFRGKAEILVGNDASEDETFALASNFARDKENFFVYDVPASHLRGKVNVLAFLANRAKGEFLLFVDADTRVSKDWFSGMQKYTDYDMITGVSIPEGETLFLQQQAYEWALMLYIFHLLSKKKIGVTSMGNNSGIRRSLYEALGGYEKIPFSITEDYALFRAAVKHGASFVNLFEASVFAVTAGVSKPSDWFKQRLRWIRGAWQGGLLIYFLSFIFCLFMHFLFSAVFFSYVFVSAVFLLICLFHSLAAIFLNLSLNKRIISPLVSFFYPIYHAVMYPLLFAYANFKGKVEWKNRVLEPE
jgi:cellulose synthase/poly-beta-1,6-N-acetylglucosamine synthase-like glycosyltransferase